MRRIIGGPLPRRNPLDKPPSVNRCFENQPQSIIIDTHTVWMVVIAGVGRCRVASNLPFLSPPFKSNEGKRGEWKEISAKRKNKKMGAGKKNLYAIDGLPEIKVYL